MWTWDHLIIFYISVIPNADFLLSTWSVQQSFHLDAKILGAVLVMMAIVAAALVLLLKGKQWILAGKKTQQQEKQKPM